MPDFLDEPEIPAMSFGDAPAQPEGGSPADDGADDGDFDPEAELIETTTEHVGLTTDIPEAESGVTIVTAAAVGSSQVSAITGSQAPQDGARVLGEQSGLAGVLQRQGKQGDDSLVAGPEIDNQAPEETGRKWPDVPASVRRDLRHAVFSTLPGAFALLIGLVVKPDFVMREWPLFAILALGLFAGTLTTLDSTRS
jgi:hypothetical protein